MIDTFKKYYRKFFADKLFIIKVSGKIVTDITARENLVKNISEFINDDINVLLIYGGGDAIDASLKEANIESLKIDGRRITRAEDIKVIKKTLVGDLGFKILESFVKYKLPANVLNALPPHWGYAIRRKKHEDTIRFDGSLDMIDSDAVRDHFLSTNLCAFPCLALTDEGTTLNVNADNMAIAIATKTNADKLILMSDIDGVKVDGKVQSVLSARECEQLIADNIATDGMRVKLENCIFAVRNGVQRVHILNGFAENALRDEVYSNKGVGTMIVRAAEKEQYMHQEVEGNLS